MRRDLLTPATMPAPTHPDPLLLFIQRAQLAIYYGEDTIRALQGSAPHS